MPIFRQSEKITGIPAVSERMTANKMVAIAELWGSEAEFKWSLRSTSELDDHIKLKWGYADQDHRGGEKAMHWGSESKGPCQYPQENPLLSRVGHLQSKLPKSMESDAVCFKKSGNRLLASVEAYLCASIRREKQTLLVLH